MEVCSPIDDEDNTVYELDEFEPVENQNSNYGVGAVPGSQNMQSNTFYSGQQTKFFDKRILAS